MKKSTFKDLATVSLLLGFSSSAVFASSEGKMEDADQSSSRPISSVPPPGTGLQDMSLDDLRAEAERQRLIREILGSQSGITRDELELEDAAHRLKYDTATRGLNLEDRSRATAENAEFSRDERAAALVKKQREIQISIQKHAMEMQEKAVELRNKQRADALAQRKTERSILGALKDRVAGVDINQQRLPNASTRVGEASSSSSSRKTEAEPPKPSGIIEDGDER